MQTYNQQPVTPGTPDSAHIVIGAAGFVAHERRQPGGKSLMNCFRDRTTTSSSNQATSSNQYGYVRGHSVTSGALFRLEQGGSITNLDRTGGCNDSGRPEAVVLLRELKSKPNKLALLKSSSSKDLTRLFLDESTTVLVSNTSLDVCSSNSSSTGSPGRIRGRESRSTAGKECCSSCSKRWQDLKQRMQTMEQDLLAQSAYSQELEQKVSEMARQLEELVREREQKKERDKQRGGGAGGGGAAAAGGGGTGSGGAKRGSPNVRPSRLVAWMNLSNWWKSRPSVETLREQRIFFDEPCFDTELELVLKHDQHRTVPRIVVDCCDLIEQKYRRSTQPIEGIYRQCGDYNKIQTLRFSIDANDYEALRQPDVDIHTLTGVLKLFLREIKSPLVSVNEAKTFIGSPNQWLLTDLSVKLDTLKRLIRSLPESNRDTMDYIFGHFNKLTKVPLQQISPETLSISVTPSIFHTVPQGVHMQDIQKLLREGETLADCVKLMIEYQGRIFECTADRRMRRLSVRNLKKTLSQPDLLFHNLF